MVFRLAAGAVAEVVVPLGLAKAGFLYGCAVVEASIGRRCCDRGASDRPREPPTQLKLCTVPVACRLLVTPQQESTCLTPRSVPERSAGQLLASEVRNQV